LNATDSEFQLLPTVCGSPSMCISDGKFGFNAPDSSKRGNFGNCDI